MGKEEETMMNDEMAIVELSSSMGLQKIIKPITKPVSEHKSNKAHVDEMQEWTVTVVRPKVTYITQT